jgi:heterodisulfide reductase subunit A-like polyferredoxin
MNILIIGGGISGISAAKVALKKKHDVTILECAEEPGGLMARIANCRVGFKTFLDEIINDPRLTIIRQGKISAVERKENRFTVTLEDGRSLIADKVIIATGLSPYDPVEYKGKRVLTSLEYDQIIDQRNGELPADFNRIAFVLCVGSRSKEYPLCSSVCCSYSLREIKWTLQRAKPAITVFYNDLRYFGQEFFLEKIYRDAGVTFIRANSRYFDEDEAGVNVRYFAEGKLKEERFDYVVLAIGLRPNPVLESLSRFFGFSLNQYKFVKENEPLKTDVEGIYVSGGALEPMSIKDSILTGFGAGLQAVRNGDMGSHLPADDERLYREERPTFDAPEGVFDSCLFYISIDEPGARIFYEFVSSKFIAMARDLKRAGKTVYVVTRNVVAPSYDELEYEEARREGVIVIHLEEGETISFSDGKAVIQGPGKEMNLAVDRVVQFDDYAHLFKDGEFLSLYRSEPQLRWNPTRWGRKKYHVGFIRHPRAERWEKREVLAAFAEMVLDEEEERVLPQINEERCSGCGSCKEACPQKAIEMEIQERVIAVFGPQVASGVPIAHVKEDTCIGCGLCASTCPSDVITYNP